MSRPLIVWGVPFFVLTLLLSGCGHAAFVAGMVAEGSDGACAVLTSSSGDSVRLDGALAGELARVPGALVRVQGKYKGRGSRRRLEVSSYRLLDAGAGVTPHVGKLVWDGTRLLMLEDYGGGAVELRGRMVPELRRQTGARVWVVGPVIDIEILEVLDYGILRPPPR